MKWANLSDDGIGTVPHAHREKGVGGALALPERALQVIRTQRPATSMSPSRLSSSGSTVKSMAACTSRPTVSTVRRQMGAAGSRHHLNSIDYYSMRAPVLASRSCSTLRSAWSARKCGGKLDTRVRATAGQVRSASRYLGSRLVSPIREARAQNPARTPFVIHGRGFA